MVSAATGSVKKRYEECIFEKTKQSVASTDTEIYTQTHRHTDTKMHRYPDTYADMLQICMKSPVLRAGGATLAQDWRALYINTRRGEGGVRNCPGARQTRVTCGNAVMR